jgi:four helix bundle protein
MGEFKFERLEVWQLSLEYLDLCLKTQIMRAATSVALNIAEGSTSQSDPEQARFLGLALRSLVETVACRRLIQHRSYLTGNEELITGTEEMGQKLFAKLQAMRRSLAGKENSPAAVRGRPSAVIGRPSAVN